MALVETSVAQAGGSYWPYDGWGHVRNYTFAVAEQNRQADGMLAEFKHLGTLYPGNSDAHVYQRRIGAMQATLGQNDAAKQTIAIVYTHEVCARFQPNSFSNGSTNTLHA